MRHCAVDQQRGAGSRGARAHATHPERRAAHGRPGAPPAPARPGRPSRSAGSSASRWRRTVSQSPRDTGPVSAAVGPGVEGTLSRVPGRGAGRPPGAPLPRRRSARPGRAGPPGGWRPPRRRRGTPRGDRSSTDLTTRPLERVRRPRSDRSRRRAPRTSRPQRRRPRCGIRQRHEGVHRRHAAGAGRGRRDRGTRRSAPRPDPLAGAMPAATSATAASGTQSRTSPASGGTPVASDELVVVHGG